MNRRRFIGLASAAVALAGVPGAAHLKQIAEAPAVPVEGWGGITPNRDFYHYSYAGIPHIDLSDWRLKIHGLVANPFELDLATIKALPSVTETLTLECIGNPPNGHAIGNALWTGPKVKPLLESARPARKAVHAALRAADRYTIGIPVEELMREENFFPHLMNRVPLPPEHGYPLRIFIPGKYGMKQSKWLTEIEFLDYEFVGSGEGGRANTAWCKVNSGLFYPQSSLFARVTRHAAMLIGPSIANLLTPQITVRTPVDIVGWAFAGPPGIRRVDISIDDGATWAVAEMVNNRSPYIWTLWKYRFAPQRAGHYWMRVRATDGDGRSQPAHDAETRTGMSEQPRLGLTVAVA